MRSLEALIMAKMTAEEPTESNGEEDTKETELCPMFYVPSG
jgi:hypothetical protein